MFNRQNILKTPKISFKTPKKFPKALDLNNNCIGNLENIKLNVSKRKDSISTNESENNLSDVNSSFEDNNQNINQLIHHYL